jgi:hypothetical protein
MNAENQFRVEYRPSGPLIVRYIKIPVRLTSGGGTIADKGNSGRAVRASKSSG